MSPDERHDTKKKAQHIDWEALRARSLERGGFGEERVEIWPKLLNVKKEKISAVDVEKSLLDEEAAHKDERQIGLDTDRSFVLYPVEPKIDRETLQADLHKLLVSLFRKRPRLSYFQGYHDIVTVLFLTLPPELRLVCVEKLSLHRLRDSMGTGLEPVLGLLRVTRNLLRLADPDFAEVLERNAPLPFYALSNLLTLFSHDVPTLPLIQHVFDFLLSRPPIASVYLAAAIILSRKKEVLHLEEEDEDGMIHSLLSSFPNLVDDVQDLEYAEDPLPVPKPDDSLEEADNTFFKDEQDTKPIELLSSANELPEVEQSVHEDGHPHGSARSVEESAILQKLSSNEPDQHAFVHAEFQASSSSDSSAKPLSSSGGLGQSPGPLSPYSAQGDPTEPHKSELPIPAPGSEVEISVKIEEQDTSQNLHPPEPSASERLASQVDHDDPWLSQPAHAPPTLILTDLLRHADELYKQFPPSHSGLSLSSIMGPQSVVYTWSESFSELPSDNMAEAMVARPELVVYPFVEETEKASEEGETSSSEEDEKGQRKEKGNPTKSRRPWKRKDSKSKPHRKRRKLKKSPFSQMEKRTMVAGTVLVLGVAMAVYGIKTRNNGGLPLFGIHEGRAVAGAAGGTGNAKELKKLGGWLGGALVGMSEKIMSGLGSAGGTVARPS